jgi:hypothetical protein
MTADRVDLSGDPQADLTEPVDLGAVPPPRSDVDSRVQRAGHNELAGAQRVAEPRQGPDEPGRCLQRAAERGRAAAGGDHFVVPAEHHAGQPQVDAVDWDES